MLVGPTGSRDYPHKLCFHACNDAWRTRVCLGIRFSCFTEILTNTSDPRQWTERVACDQCIIGLAGERRGCNLYRRRCTRSYEAVSRSQVTRNSLYRYMLARSSRTGKHRSFDPPRESLRLCFPLQRIRVDATIFFTKMPRKWTSEFLRVRWSDFFNGNFKGTIKGVKMSRFRCFVFAIAENSQLLFYSNVIVTIYVLLFSFYCFNYFIDIVYRV